MRNLNKTYHKGKYRSGEWSRHLRPYLKRIGNKKFRRAALNLEYEEYAKYKRLKNKRPNQKIRVKITLQDNEGRKTSHFRNFRSMKGLQESVSRPKVIRYYICSEV